MLSALESLGGYFMKNEGQTTAGVHYYSIGNPSVAFRDDGVMFVLREAHEDMLEKAVPRTRSPAPTLHEEGAKSLAYFLRFEGANKVLPSGRGQLPFRSNFFKGSDPNSWVTDIPSFREVVYSNLYDGIDLTYRQSRDGLKYEFLANPGANPGVIKMSYDGIQSLRIDARGMVVETEIGEIVDSVPYSYQNEGMEVECEFVLRGGLTYGFDCSEWDKSSPLTIDPLLYSTYLGGGGSDRGYAVTVDQGGNAYVTGRTTSADFPTTPGSYDLTLGGTNDAFVTKLNSAGTSIVYSTFLGGGNSEMGLSIALDSGENAYVTGETTSPDFPTSPGAYDTGFNGNWDVFVTKLDPAGGALVYSTYVGGSENETWSSIALDSSGNAYIAGMTQSSDFPTTPGADDRTYNGGTEDAFVAKLNAAGSALVYSTFVGGGDSDFAYFIVLDSTLNAYVTGGTGSDNFPTTPGAFDRTFEGYADVFVTKVDATGGSLVYSTYLGGGDYDVGLSLAVDSSGIVHVTGVTASADFPTTPGAYDTTINSLLAYDAFMTELNAAGTTLLYSTYLGGNGDDYGNTIVLDLAGNAYMTGGTGSTDFPVTAGAFDSALGGSGDAFVTRLDSTGFPTYSTYLGGSGADDYLPFLAIDATGASYVTGITQSSDFPTTPNAFDKTLGGTSDGFVTKLALFPNNPPRAPWPLFFQGLSSDSNDSRVFHITTLSNFQLGWTFSDPDLEVQTQASVAISLGPNRAATVWNSVVNGMAQSALFTGTLQTCTQYWYSVMTKDPTEYGPLADWRLRTNCPPSGLSNLAPPNMAILFPGSQNVSWTYASDIDPGDTINYTWRVATDPAYGNIISTGTTSYNYSANFTTLGMMVYYWSVNASDGWVSIPYTPTWQFRTTTGPMPPIVDSLTIDTYPSGDAHLAHFTNRVSPVFGWRFLDVNGDSQQTYLVELKYSSNNTLAWNLSGSGPNTTVAYSGSRLLDGVDYYLVVNASDDSPQQLWSGWSLPLNFHINTPPPVPAEPVVPISGSTIPAGSVIVQWTSGGGDPEGDIVTYEYCVDTVSPPVGCSVSQGDNITAPQSNSFTTLAGTTYYWQAKAWDGYEPSAWSVIWNFSTESPPVNTPPNIVLLNPPTRLKQGTIYDITCSMFDVETPQTNLVVYLNYSYGGNVYQIAGPLVGTCTYQWTAPMIERTDVRINATVIDEGGLKGWNETPQFEIFANKRPAIALENPPARIRQGSSYSINWTMSDLETPISQLVVYLNYTSGGNTYQIAGPLVGQTRYQWSVPLTVATDVRINATVIDQDYLKNWSETPEFEIYKETQTNTPPSIVLANPPTRLKQGTTYSIMWTMNDFETSEADLVVYLNYTRGGNTFTIAGPLKGLTSYQWTVPSIVATDVKINSTVIDEGGLRGFDETTSFEIYEEATPNTRPVIVLANPPARLKQGTTHNITWTMSDVETPASDLVVYLNYSYGGGSYVITGPLKGQMSFQWTAPVIEATDVMVNATVIDGGGLRNWSTTAKFEVYNGGAVTPPSKPVELWWLWIVVVAIAVALLVFFIVLWKRRKKKESETGATTKESEEETESDSPQQNP